MNREIKFRGQRVDNKEWVYGYYYQATKGMFVNPIQNASVITTYKVLDNGEIILTGSFEVIPETVGQYTGLKDKNGVEIYEGDVLQSEAGDRHIWDCKVEDGCFRIFQRHDKTKKGCNYEDILCEDNIGFFSLEVIGNIHDNCGKALKEAD